LKANSDTWQEKGFKHELGTGCCYSGLEETNKNTWHQESDSAGEHHSTLHGKFSLTFLAFTHAKYLLFEGFGLFVSGLAWF
jgi:hypothetical protein